MNESWVPVKRTQHVNFLKSQGHVPQADLEVKTMKSSIFFFFI